MLYYFWDEQGGSAHAKGGTLRLLLLSGAFTCMLPEQNRLRKVRDFNLLMKYGRYAKSGELTLRYLDVSRLPEDMIPKREKANEFRRQLKCAFSVGLKVSKKAVERNRLRRRLREIIRLYVSKDAVRPGTYLLVIGHKSLLKATSDALLQMVQASLRQAGLLIKS